jgi:hypothetical protein
VGAQIVRFAGRANQDADDGLTRAVPGRDLARRAALATRSDLAPLAAYVAQLHVAVFAPAGRRWRGLWWRRRSARSRQFAGDGIDLRRLTGRAADHLAAGTARRSGRNAITFVRIRSVRATAARHTVTQLAQYVAGQRRTVMRCPRLTIAGRRRRRWRRRHETRARSGVDVRTGRTTLPGVRIGHSSGRTADAVRRRHVSERAALGGRKR